MVAARLAVLAALLAVAHAADLYGMSPKVALLRVDPKLANTTAVSPPLAYELQGQGLAAGDSVRNIFYIIGTNASSDLICLIGISTETGKVLHEFALPFLLEAFVGVGQYLDVEQSTGDVIVTGRDYIVHQHIMYRVTKGIKKIIPIARVGDRDLIEILGGTSCLDQKNGINWIQLARNDSGTVLIRFYGYDINSGFLYNVIDDMYGLATMVYDSHTGLIFGLGSVGEERALLSFDSTTTTFTVVSKVPYTDLMSGISALNPLTRTFYAFMSKQSAKKGTNSALTVGDAVGDAIPMNLVGINIGSGAITSQPQACADFPDCPWSLVVV